MFSIEENIMYIKKNNNYFILYINKNIHSYTTQLAVAIEYID